MRICFTIILSFLIAFICNAQLPEINYPTVGVLDGVYIKKVDSALVVSDVEKGCWVGQYKEYYDSAHQHIHFERAHEIKFQLKEKDTIWYALRTGICNTYDTLGRVIRKEFCGDEKSGTKEITYSYYPNGQLRKEEVFDPAIPRDTSQTIVFRDSLNKKLYRQTDDWYRVKSGVQKIYHPNGKLKTIGKYYPVYFNKEEDLIKKPRSYSGVLDGVYVKDPYEGPKVVKDRYAKDSIWTEYDKDGNKIGETHWDKGQYLSGTWIQYYDNDQIYSIGELVNWKKEGIWKTYYPDGTPKSEAIYKANVKERKEYKYHPNGNLWQEHFYAIKVATENDKKQQVKTINPFTKNPTKVSKDSLHNIREGTSSFYYVNGNLRERGSYLPIEFQNRTYIKDGVWEKYDSTGRKKTKTEYRNGDVYNGWFKIEHTNHQPIYQVKVKNGKPTGEWNEYTRDGKLKGKGTFKNGQKHGKWEWYHHPQRYYGKIYKEENWNNGVKEGFFGEYDRYGQKTKGGHYKNGKKEGVWGSYVYENKEDKIGKLKFGGPYVNGLKEGKWINREYNNNYSAEHYKAGQKHGIREFYALKRYTNNPKPEDYFLKIRSHYINDQLAGVHEKYYRDGQLAEKGVYRLATIEDPYKKPYKTGDWFYYNKKGVLMKEEHYNETITKTLTPDFELQQIDRTTYRQNIHPIRNKRGNWAKYDSKGDLKQKTVYQFGQYKSGIGYIIRKWDKDQNKMRVTMSGYYELDSNKQYVSRYPDGTLKIRGNYVTGDVPAGQTSELWYPNGQLKEQTISKKYDKNLRNYVTRWYANGQKKSEGQILASYPYSNKKDSIWTHWHTNGQVAEKVNYQLKADTVSRYFSWHNNGQQKAMGFMSFHNTSNFFGLYSFDEYSNSFELNGRVKQQHWSTWHPNGNMASDGNYKDDRKTGTWKYWHENGMLKSTGEMKGDRKIGEWKYFDEKGQPTTTFNHGTGAYDGELFNTNWITTNGPQGCDPTSFYLDENGKWWLGTGSSGGVFTSTDKGKTWNAENKGIGPVHVRYIGKINNNIYIETSIDGSLKGGDIFKYANGSWALIDDKTKADSILISLKKDAKARQHLFNFEVDTTHRVWRYFDNTVTRYKDVRNVKIKYEGASTALIRSYPNDVFTQPGGIHFQTDSRNSILLAKSGIYSFNGKTFSPNKNKGLIASDIKHVVAAPDSSLWVLEGITNIWQYKNNNWINHFNAYQYHKNEAEQRVNYEYQTYRPNVHPDGTVLFGANSHIWKIDAKGNRSILMKGNYETEKHYSAAMDIDGTIWTVSKIDRTHQLLHFDKNGQLIQEEETNKYRKWRSYLVCDKAGKIWHIGQNGIRQIGSNADPKATYVKEGFNYRWGNAIGIGNHGKLAYFLDESTLIIWNGTQWERKETEQLKGMLSLGFDNNGDLYAGTGFIEIPACGIMTYGWAHGLFKLNGTQWEEIENNVNPWILSLATHPTKGLAIGTSGSGLWLLKTKK